HLSTLSLHDALPISRSHGSLLSPAGVCLPEMALPSGLPYRKPHLSFRMRPYIPENRSSSPCAAGSCSGSDPLSAVPGTSIACARSEEHTSELQSRFD